MRDDDALHGDDALPRLLALGRTARHLGRYREVAEVLVRHGLGALVGVAGLSHLLPRRLRGLAHPGRPLVAVHLRQALEELGPTFIKLGQVLSLRADLLPPDFVRELALLQDRVPGGTFEQARSVMEAELGQPVQRLFARVDPVPLASASLGEVYAATLPGGQPVVVKVLRAGVERQVATDLEILRDLARVARHRLPSLPVDPVAWVDEFARILRREMDLRQEALHLQRFRRNFRGDTRIHLPRLYPRLSGTRVLTMERLWGVRVDDVETLERWGVDRRRLARLGARMFLKMVLVDRFFHGDPHPGNLLVDPTGRLVLLDFGMAGALSPEMTAGLVSTFVAVARQDASGAVRGMARMGIVPPSADRERLRRDLQELIDHHYNRPLSEVPLRQLVEDAMELVRRHRLALPAELLMLSRALVLLDGLGRQLDPSFNPLEVALPFARRLVVRQLHPAGWVRAWSNRAEEALELVAGLPGRADRLLRELESGRLTVGLRWAQPEVALRRLERSINRLALALALVALAVSGSVLWVARVGPAVAGMPVVALVALVGALLAGLGLMWGIWRSGRV